VAARTHSSPSPRGRAECTGGRICAFARVARRQRRFDLAAASGFREPGGIRRDPQEPYAGHPFSFGLTVYPEGHWDSHVPGIQRQLSPAADKPSQSPWEHPDA
jgi:hypothetical protein